MEALWLACCLVAVLRSDVATSCPDNRHDFNELEVFIDPPFSEYATRYINDPNLKLPKSLCSIETTPLILGTYCHPSSMLPQTKNDCYKQCLIFYQLN